MSKTRTFNVTLVVKSFFTGRVEAMSSDDAIEQTYRLWRTECPHPFDESDDSELVDVGAEEVRS